MLDTGTGTNKLLELKYRIYSNSSSWGNYLFLGHFFDNIFMNFSRINYFKTFLI